MRELTQRQMSETDGGYAFWPAFLCGALVVATVFTFVVTPPVGKLARWLIYSGGATACGEAFF